MAEPKTQPTGASVSAYLDALTDERLRNDCHRLVQMMTRVTGAPPVLWGTSIVGFDAYRYTYASGTRGDWPVIGFAPRARDLTLYLMDGFEQRADTLARLGRHTHSKSCLHVKSLADVDLGVLEAMLADSVRVMRARHPTGAAATDRLATRTTHPPARATPANASARKAATRKLAPKKVANTAAAKQAAPPQRTARPAVSKPSTAHVTTQPAPAGRKRARSP